MKTIMIALALVCGSVSAAELEIGLFTHHWISEGVNNDTELVGLYHNGFEVGTMRNSFGDRSYIAGYRFELTGGFSLSVGAIHGYGDNAKGYPVRFGETVMYPSVNYTHRLSDRLSVRVRQMAEVSLVTFAIQFSKPD